MWVVSGDSSRVEEIQGSIPSPTPLIINKRVNSEVMKVPK